MTDFLSYSGSWAGNYFWIFRLKWVFSDRHYLRRWSDGAISNALDKIGRQTHSKLAGIEVNRVCSGVHALISETLNRANGQKGNSANTAIKIAKNVKESWIANNVESPIAELGITTEFAGIRSLFEDIYMVSDRVNDEFLISKLNFEKTIDDFFKRHYEDRYSERASTNMKDWLERLGLVSKSKEDRTKLRFCQLVMELIDDEGY